MSAKIGFCRRFLIILLFYMIANSLNAAEPGFELTKACRANLTKLREATEQALKDGVTHFPVWGRLQDVYTMVLTNKYLAQQPKPPTKDCDYYLVFKDPANFDWYCTLHGVIGGDSSVTFRYHQYQVTAFTNSKYMNIPKYKAHADNLLRWATYEPTLVENIKYHYARNPLTTVIITAAGVLFMFFLIRNIFEI